MRFLCEKFFFFNPCFFQKKNLNLCRNSTQKEKSMKKTDLVEKVKELAGLESKAAAERALNAVLDGIEAGLQKDGEVQLIGFGTFRVKDRPAREGRNPLTGEKMKIKASRTVAFKVGAALKADATKKGKKK